MSKKIDSPTPAPKKIVVENYNAQWAITFQAFKAIYQNLLGDLALSIEHVGSTSVVGLAAKPIIDMDIVVRNEADLQAVLQKMSLLGYRHLGDFGIKNREVLKGISDKVPIDGSNKIWQKHHLYVCIEGVSSLDNHLKFRNYLRQHPQKAQEYGELKQRLAQQFTYDIDEYIAHKTPFITAVLEATGFDATVLKSIRAENAVKK